MKHFTLSDGKSLTKFLFLFCLMLLFSTPLLAKRGWNNGDTTYFKHHIKRRFDDSIKVRRINDSICKNARFDSSLVGRWNDTIFFHHKFDTAFAHERRQRFDSAWQARLDSGFTRRFPHRFDTICAKHFWNDTSFAWKKGNDTIIDTIYRHYWNDTIIVRRHREYIILNHRVSLCNAAIINKISTTDNASLAIGASVANGFLPASVVIYPNPISNNATINIANSGQAVTFRLYDATGRLVISIENLSNGSAPLNRNELPAGMYFYRVLNSTSVISTGKLVFN